MYYWTRRTGKQFLPPWAWIASIGCLSTSLKTNFDYIDLFTQSDPGCQSIGTSRQIRWGRPRWKQTLHQLPPQDMWLVTYDTWHVTCDTQGVVNIASSCQLPSSNSLRYLVWKIFPQTISQSEIQLISNGGDCRTAPATPGLLIILIFAVLTFNGSFFSFLLFFCLKMDFYTWSFH